MKIDITYAKPLDNTVHYNLRVPKLLRKYFLQDGAYIQYDSSLNIRDIDDSILAIPIVSVIAPIAWAVGADISVPELDTTFLQSISRVKEVYRDFHPSFSFSGEILTGKTVRHRFGSKRNGMLFSGGVDSLTSYLRHKDKCPDLFSIWGVPDIPPSEEIFWGTMWSEISDLANRDGVNAFHIKTDAFRNINHELLGKEFGCNWWGAVTGGLFLLSMCAPLTAVRKITTLIIASSYTGSFKAGSGFHPLIDENVSWADVNVIHDGYELSRQQKLKYLCQSENLPYLSHLRVCCDSAYKTNCGKCEKCLRTITGLAIEGVEPTNCNFEIDRKTFPYLQDNFTKGAFKAGAGLVYMWSDIQKHIPELIDTDIKGSKEFLTWLRRFDISQYRENTLRHFLWMAQLQYDNKRIKATSIRRKIKCYYYMLLDKLKFS